jgi:hypothetical protein
MIDPTAKGSLKAYSEFQRSQPISTANLAKSLINRTHRVHSSPVHTGILDWYVSILISSCMRTQYDNKHYSSCHEVSSKHDKRRAQEGGEKEDREN